MPTISKTISLNEWNALFRGRDTSKILRLDRTGLPINEIHIKGSTALIENEDVLRIAIVGTRDISPYGKECTRRIINALAKNPAKPFIISGLAMGVDTEAFVQALHCGLPAIAVLPTGLDTIYPYQNRSLAKDIASTPGSCLLSQFPEKTAPTPIHFLSRNNVIAAISDIVIVVESKSKGGALVTARYGYDLGAKVFAVPGRIDDIRSAGCNDLIQKGLASILTDFETLSQLSTKNIKKM